MNYAILIFENFLIQAQSSEGIDALTVSVWNYKTNVLKAFSGQCHELSFDLLHTGQKESD